MRTCPQIALLIDTATGWGRRIIRGIARYGQEQGGWDLWLEQRCQHAPGRLPPGWRGEGVIARVADRSLARHLEAAPGVIVNVSAARIPGVSFPTVAADLRVAARLAVDHLLDQGFRNFGYFAPLGMSYVDAHHEGFTRALLARGHRCSVLVARRGAGAIPWHRRQRDLRAWLKSLPKPVAVLAWTSDRGRETLYACRALGLLVPEEVAVLSADEDILLCETSYPPLSAVALTSERIGYEAAALLDRLRKGARAPARPILIEPTRVVVRQSTNTLAVNDRKLAQAIGFIRNHATEPIQVGDILRAAPMSRSNLERRFREVLGRSPAGEIRRVRIERAKQLLADTDMSVPDVAEATGFQSREYLAHAFKRATGMTPREFRARVRGW
ncbi:MAG: DNA-binding transcriptional regulator [Verrucomicrobiae bacterium]|nr:DNA-binding transcriptional regulator [Verrucomicrobiae bacterium]